MSLDRPHPPHIALRPVATSDLDALYRFQLDEASLAMAEFPARNWPTFQEHWNRVLADPRAVALAIEADGRLVGNIGCWTQAGHREVGYWIDRAHWGKGIATAALRELLAELSERPLYAYVAAHNVGSMRVLENCAFVAATGSDVPADDPPQAGQRVYVLR
jgi:RimJ/RimL family protein N-acetyltransferase